MSSAYTLFEVSWEVCNKVGGIHTVVSTKAKTMVERLGDQYVTLGPWRLSDGKHHVPFEEDPSFREFAEDCHEMGVPVRVGRWLVPGRPRTILVEFSQLIHKKDDVLGRLWELYRVDSLSGGWDYVEPVLFGWAAAKVIERWWEEFTAPAGQGAIVHVHEWMTGSAMLYLKKSVPAMGTVFTTHATMLGRALSSHGRSPEGGLGGRNPAELASEQMVVAKHSLEGVCAREADVFTTVSEVTAREAKLLHGRAASPILTNGIDLSVLDEMAGPRTRVEARRILSQMAASFLGEPVDDALFLGTSGRYEFHNKGLDVLLEAMARLNAGKGKRVVLFVLVPAGNSGVKSALLARRSTPPDGNAGPLGISTHNLTDEDHDPVHMHCARLGLVNAPGARVKVIHVPIYLDENDGFLGLPYAAVLRGLDLTCFPSFYEPWGYTPQESVAVGVPTITSNYAGFGRWALGLDLDFTRGVTVLERVGVVDAEAARTLAAELEVFLNRNHDLEALREACRRTAALTAWSDVVANYETAYRSAISAVQGRLHDIALPVRRPKKRLTVQPAPEGQRPRLFRFDVSATLPNVLKGLRRLAHNYWWCWDPDGRDLYRELSPISWEISGHDPIQLLQRVYPEDIEAKAKDEQYTDKLKRVLARFDAYMAEPREKGRWRAVLEKPGETGISDEHPVAYFCAEYGIHSSLRIYSGGLGILAGDHLKSASDLNLPFLAIGLFYRRGYLTQRMTTRGEQIDEGANNDPISSQFDRVLDHHGHPLVITIGLPGRDLQVAAWRVDVGRVPLYLLDTDLPANRPEDRAITRQLYGGDHETRIQQEIVLGRGGIRLLRGLGIKPAVYHMNEGHSAFLTLERVGLLAHREGLTFDEAREFVRASTLFTTHTPIPAGHDRFAEDVMRRYFSGVAESLGIPWERFYDLGLSQSQRDAFNMTYLAIGFSSYCNGVSDLHGVASRHLLHGYWPRLLESEVPVDSITNGVHLPTWTHPDIARSLGVSNRPIVGEDFARPATKDTMRDLWRTKGRLKRQLLDQVRLVLERSFLERGDSPLLLNRILDGFDESALLIGFARRFAPYKRAHLLFKDRRRIADLLASEERPLRLLIAGKAHPADGIGKGILQEIFSLSRTDELAGRVIFVEDYDLSLARSLLTGVDVWLNTPTRMLEASGTSGMKAAANGVLNLSIGDGWWPEAYDGRNGWLIGGERSYKDQELQDQLDCATLYNLLEEEILPTFFTRDEHGVPWRWLEMMAASLRTIPSYFNTDRMVGDYLKKAYDELGRNYVSLSRERKEKLKAIALDRQNLRKGFAAINIVSAEVADLSGLKVGETVSARVEVDLGPLSPADVAVELVIGNAKNDVELRNSTTVRLTPVEPAKGTVHAFEGSHVVARSGNYAYGIRVRAAVADKHHHSLRDLVLWA
ncbi:MAG: alpha-glucan family phosphorylase [Planctomycetota bacterium]